MPTNATLRKGCDSPRRREHQAQSAVDSDGEQVRPELEAKPTARRPVTAGDYRARSVLFVDDKARLSQGRHRVRRQ